MRFFLAAKRKKKRKHVETLVNCPKLTWYVVTAIDEKNEYTA